MAPGRFDREEVILTLRKAGSGCDRDVEAFLIGGGAMALRGEKDSTKDVDLILRTEEEALALAISMTSLGFTVHLIPPMECSKMVDARILTEPNGMRVDIFVGRICDKLTFTDSMRSRSEPFERMGRLSLHICSREDIFLLKSVTERDRDLDDMVTLLRAGIDSHTVLEECILQSELEDPISGRVYETFLLMKVEEIEAKFTTAVPWKDELKAMACLKLAERLTLDRIAKGIDTFPRLGMELGLPKEYLRKVVSNLQASGKVYIEKGQRPYRISIVRTNRTNDASKEDV